MAALSIYLRKQADEIPGPLDSWSSRAWAKLWGGSTPEETASARAVVKRRDELGAVSTQPAPSWPRRFYESVNEIGFGRSPTLVNLPAEKIDPGAAGVSNKDIKDYADYVRQINSTGWDPTKSKAIIGAKLEQMGYFPSQAEADRMQRAHDFVAQHPDIGSNYGLSPQGSALAASDLALKNFSGDVRAERYKKTGPTMGRFLDWANTNKKWLIPVGIGAVGLGLGAMMLGGGSGEDAQKKKKSTSQAPLTPAWKVGDRL